MHVLQGAIETNIERATFNEVGGNQYNGENSHEIEAPPKSPPRSPSKTTAFGRAFLPVKPAATPAMAQPPQEMHILSNATDTKARYTVFSSIAGDQYSDAAAASLSRTKRAPPAPVKPQADRQRMHVLAGAKRTDAQFAVFSSVGGNQYGIPQPQVNTSSQSTTSKQEWYLEDESMC